MERQQMMLADGEQFDVAYKDHFVGVHLETGFQHFLRPMSEAGEQLLACSSDTVRRVQQTFTFGILADGLQKQAHGLAHAFLVIADRPGRMGGTGLVVEKGIEIGIAHQLVNPALCFSLSGIGTGGMSESGRFSSLNQTSRFGAFLMLAKMAASSFSLSVSLTSS